MDGNLNANRYIELLGNNLIHNLNEMLPQGGFFQHDNAPIHTAGVTRQWLFEHDIAIYPWPAVSPDMNPIENVWARMETILQRNYEIPQNAEELYNTLRFIWNDIMANQNYRQSLVQSMIERVHSLHEASGGYTSY